MDEANDAAAAEREARLEQPRSQEERARVASRAAALSEAGGDVDWSGFRNAAPSVYRATSGLSGPPPQFKTGKERAEERAALEAEERAALKAAMDAAAVRARAEMAQAREDARQRKVARKAAEMEAATRTREAAQAMRDAKVAMQKADEAARAAWEAEREEYWERPRTVDERAQAQARASTYGDGVDWSGFRTARPSVYRATTGLSGPSPQFKTGKERARAAREARRQERSAMLGNAGSKRGSGESAYHGSGESAYESAYESGASDVELSAWDEEVAIWDARARSHTPTELNGPPQMAGALHPPGVTAGKQCWATAAERSKVKRSSIAAVASGLSRVLAAARVSEDRLSAASVKRADAKRPTAKRNDAASHPPSYPHGHGVRDSGQEQQEGAVVSDHGLSGSADESDLVEAARLV